MKKAEILNQTLKENEVLATNWTGLLSKFEVFYRRNKKQFRCIETYYSQSSLNDIYSVSDNLEGLEYGLNELTLIA